MPTRRAFLRGVLGAGLTPTLGGCGGSTSRHALSSASSTERTSAPSSPSSSVQAGGLLPVDVVNETGRFGNDSIWLYVVGTDLGTGRQGHVGPDGKFAPAVVADNGADGFANFAIPFAAAAATPVQLPYMSGRMYVAMGQQLKFRVLPGGKLQYPAPWAPGDASAAVVHDCWEFTHNADGMFCNTTMVDMFSVPISLSLIGERTQTTGTLTAGGRRRIFERIAAQPAFARLVVPEVRVLAPGHALDAGLFAADYLRPAIDQFWKAYATRDLRISTSRGDFVGRVNGNRLVFDGGVRPFVRPTTREVLFCDGALAAPNDGVSGPVAAILGAAFNRGVLKYADQPVVDATTFYSGPLANHYAAAMHASAADGKAYGFAFDDVAGHASYVEDRSPTSLTVRLTAFD